MGTSGDGRVRLCLLRNFVANHKNLAYICSIVTKMA